mmetsp:Transcript_48204/g.35391  ORF Transcript_48204/g.35391 Transcript_48204/m.35391 type:complete len:85 (+) Transcript_48204:524-778(+)|eukprot:CAMPEP_0202964636 /NCGR_PEP_ID=MMETSP1396-20130829/8710_1 /ASSEMBLY_ACC=CAM_ASM_000872 /TAXON_ID= /ORGANISM="Pseudokeronopsis sp., Strain Brazil" /LENGTH=84 /DNA_ID=CAMNT_0049686875 /DNA_START=781 /DNA_END=1035 /DNA_ORIENTATION=+
MKHVARVAAKKYLVGLKEGALTTLKDQGMMVAPIEQSVNESVLPWVLEKMGGFLEEDRAVQLLSEKVVIEAYELMKEAHRAMIE